ncbi:MULTISPECIES: TraR/DksA C4-type zinc finger protein [unclassified Psychrobacter]|uniref:TraR/DksA C4-type zinc finger protein n=1 Tax=unclassified Psychrobacter TaxID=196806 RepID=UPI0018F428FC|nr:MULTISPECIES: TraR/DksA C4-type zinc finger protein [unclassified Psychrobacter]
MGDIIDDGNRAAAIHLDAALSQIKRPVANSATECIDCGDPIGAARKAAAPYATRCAECQGFYDKESR